MEMFLCVNFKRKQELFLIYLLFFLNQLKFQAGYVADAPQIKGAAQCRNDFVRIRLQSQIGQVVATNNLSLFSVRGGSEEDDYDSEDDDDEVDLDDDGPIPKPSTPKPAASILTPSAPKPLALVPKVTPAPFTRVKIKMTYSGVGWIGVGVSSAGSMVGSVAVIGAPDTVKKYNLNDKFVGTGGVAPSSQQTLESWSWSQTTQTVMEFVAPLNWNNGVLSFQSSGNTQMIYAYGSSNTLGYHAGRRSFTVNLAFCVNGANSGDSRCKSDDANYDQVQVLSGGVVKVYSKLLSVAPFPAPTKPVVSAPKPIVSAPKPAAAVPKPSAPKSAASIPKPSAPKPAVPVPKPSAPKPAASIPKPSAPKPAASIPKPSAPKPAAPIPKPSAPKPAAFIPKPSAPKPIALVPKVTPVNSPFTLVKIKMIYSGVGWTGVGVSSAGSMVGSVAVIGTPDMVQKYVLNDKFVGTGGVAPSSQQTLESWSWSQITTQTVMEFVAPLNWNNGVLSFQSSGNTQMIYAYGSSNTLGYHAGRASFTVNLAYCLNGANSGDSKCKPDDANYDQVQVLSGGVVKVFTKLF